MDDSQADPRLLFTPPMSTTTSLKGDDPAPPLHPKTRTKETRLFVQPPPLPAGEKHCYKDIPESFIDAGAEFDVTNIDGVIGEYLVDRQLHYFVRFKDGVAHRVRCICLSVRFLCSDTSFTVSGKGFQKSLSRNRRGIW